MRVCWVPRHRHHRQTNQPNNQPYKTFAKKKKNSKCVDVVTENGMALEGE